VSSVIAKIPFSIICYKRITAFFYVLAMMKYDEIGHYDYLN